jgi:predicted ABC-type ATPase
MRPRMIVIAGPPGSGKSTVFRPDEEQIDYFNADERARDLNGGFGRNISPEIRRQVNEELEQFIANHIQHGESFAYETTLRTTITCLQARHAKAHGFETNMSYVALNSVEESIRRVRSRAEHGGHSAPPERIREIYQASLRNLPQALSEFDSITIYDNSDSGASGPAKIFRTIEGKISEVVARTPEWLDNALRGTAFEVKKPD